jgi:D-mannonate dehydratase
MSDPFNEAFGLPEEPKKTLEVIKPPVENSEEDFQYARQNLYQTIELAAHSLDALSQLAEKAQNARLYEVLANLTRTVVDANKELLDLQKKRKDLQQGGLLGSQAGSHTVNNNLFMTTAEFQHWIEAQQKKLDDGNPE